MATATSVRRSRSCTWSARRRLDEAPKAYKDIERVMQQQSDLVEIVAELKQVVCVKG